MKERVVLRISTDLTNTRIVFYLMDNLRINVIYDDNDFDIYSLEYIWDNVDRDFLENDDFDEDTELIMPEFPYEIFNKNGFLIDDVLNAPYVEFVSQKTTKQPYSTLRRI